MIKFKYRPNTECDLWICHICKDLEEVYKYEETAREMGFDYRIENLETSPG